MEGVDARGVEGVGHDGPHRAHVGGPVGGAGPVPGQEPQPLGGAVALGGVGVHDQDLGLGAVQLDVEGQGVLDLGGHLGGGDAGVVFDGAGGAGDVFFAAALAVRGLGHGAGVLGLVGVGQEGHQIALDGGGVQGGRGRGGGGRAAVPGGGAVRPAGLLRLPRLPLFQSGAEGGQGPRQRPCQDQGQPPAPEGQGQHHRRRGQGRPACPGARLARPGLPALLLHPSAPFPMVYTPVVCGAKGFYAGRRVTGWPASRAG